MIKAVFFDLDGTIADTFDIAYDVGMNIIGDTGYDLPIQKHDIRNLNSAELKKKFKISKLMWLKGLRFIPRARRDMHKVINQAKPCSDMPRELKKLRKSYKLGIITSNSKQNVDAFITQHKLDMFDFVLTGSSIFGKDKRIKKALVQCNIKPHEAVYVGDEVRDFKAAQKVGVRCISVSWGFNSRELLKREGARTIIAKPGQISTTLAKWNR